MVSPLPVPTVIAHRGASRFGPENTLAAFQLALDAGAKAIEVDLRLTADLNVVAFHDANLYRTTGTFGKVSDFTLEQLQLLDAGATLFPEHKGEKIPSLDEILEILPADILLNLELKNQRAPASPLPEVTAGMIAKHQAQNRILISSFNPLALLKIRRALPDIRCGQLLYTHVSIELHKWFPSLSANSFSIHLPFNKLSRRTVARFKSRGKKVLTYTINRPDQFFRAIELGVDGFFTDDPALAIASISGGGHPAESGELTSPTGAI